MIKKDTTFNFRGVTSGFCMKYAGTTTQAVLATIRPRSTAGRPPPPDCGNGFDTSYLPFAKGHVIALELGGSDEPFNVVPQFEDWQGKLNGAWRQMEVALGAYPAHVMLVQIGYNRPGPNEAHDVAVAAFQVDRLRDWVDTRIPDVFRVRVWKSSEDPAAIDGDAAFDAMIARLEKAVPAYETAFNLGTGLPEPDRSMYVNQAALDVAMDLWNEDAFPSFPTFMLQPGTVANVRADLRALPGIVPTEASNVQALPIMCAYQKGLTAPKVRRMVNDMDKRGLKRAGSDLLGLPPAKKKKTK
jgi:hypothetical protein